METPGTLYVKRTQCRSCRGPKVTKPKTGYVYCDYCATLTDWDFQACMAVPPSAPHHPKHADEAAKLKTEIDAALASQDRARYYRAQCAFYELYVALNPGALSPRVGDPAYRAAFIDYTAKTCTEQDFDAAHNACTEEVARVSKSLQWDTKGPKMRVTGATFWPMWEAFGARVAASLDVNVRTGLIAHQPDGAPRELLERMGLSAMVQGWLQYLSPEDAERLLVVSRMKGDYVSIAAPATTLTACSGCRSDLHVVQGARRVVCEACGRLNEVGVASITCPTCGGNVSLAAGTNVVACPYCRTDLRAMRP